MIEDFAKESVKKWFDEQGVSLGEDDLKSVMDILMETFDLVKSNRPKMQMSDDRSQAAINLVLSSVLNAVRVMRAG